MNPKEILHEKPKVFDDLVTLANKTDTPEVRSEVPKQETIVKTVTVVKKPSQTSRVNGSKTKAATKKGTKSAKPPVAKPSPKQLGIPGTDKNSPNETDVISLLKKRKVKFVDKRDRNGALWIIGGSELKPIVDECKSLGYKFIFKEDGGRQTGNKPGWWTKQQ